MAWIKIKINSYRDEQVNKTINTNDEQKICVT